MLDEVTTPLRVPPKEGLYDAAKRERAPASERSWLQLKRLLRPRGLPFLLFHFIPLLAFWIEVRPEAWVLCGALYVTRMFGVTAGYHRYFSHRTFKTSRIFQFLLAFWAQTSAQKGVLWWAAHHRHHHKHSDDPEDVHSPRQRGFWYSHLGWIYDGTNKTEHHRVKDLGKYPELRWLDTYYYLPPIALFALVTWLCGLDGLIIGCVLSTTLLWHGTFTINSLAHMFGARRFPTRDDSRNNLWLALLTLGEGWHNNHHFYMNCARQGFTKAEIDVTYYLLLALRSVGVVWDLKEPPKSLTIRA